MSYGMYSGSSYDCLVERTDDSTLGKMQQQYWTTKQAVMKKLGKREDEFVVAGDAELDAKLEVFHSIETSCLELLRVIELYQDKLCALSQEENAAGRFLKEQSKRDKTRAGKMMAAVGKSLSFSAQQRLALRVPLVRLYQEVETFRNRAVSDTLLTINRMETSRTEYRGALMWMKDVSQELNPDTYKQLEKFRKVQAQVRKTKAKFDKLKFDCLQKIDLLAASRCNMFSHVLVNYQSTLLHFWEKTSRTMSAVMESFKGYQHYEFSMLKELTEPSRKLAEATAAACYEQAERDTDEAISNLDKLISFEEQQHLEEFDSQYPTPKTDSLQNLMESSLPSASPNKTANQVEPFKKLEKADDMDFSGRIDDNRIENNTKPTGTIDLLTDSLETDDNDKDDMTLLQEILNAPMTSGDDFSKEWKAVFDNSSLSGSPNYVPVESDKPQISAEFMPSQLLDMNSSMTNLSLTQGTTSQSVQLPQTGDKSAKPMTASSKKMGADMSAWFNLFADLDPLANPDAIGKKEGELDDDRNC